MNKEITCLAELISFVSMIGDNTPNLLVFRGENKDYGGGSLVPLVYRGYIADEDKIYRESQRFNDHEFNTDKTAFDKLSRIQHYSAPTRLIDVSEDLFSAIYFAIAEKDLSEDDKSDALIYIFEIKKEKIKYYDSDTVSVISNLAKIPLSNEENEKSKEQLLEDIKESQNIKKFNKKKSVKFLRHEIREEKPQFEAIIKPEHLTSIQFVYPKLSSYRVKSQKGAFFLFGLNCTDARKPIKILDEKGNLIKSESMPHPIEAVHIASLKHCNIGQMKKELNSLGIKKSFVYPEIDKVSEYLKEIHKKP